MLSCWQKYSFMHHKSSYASHQKICTYCFEHFSLIYELHECTLHILGLPGLLHIAYLDNLRWYILHLRTWAKNLFKCFCFRKFKVLKMGIFTHKVQGSISSHVFFIIGQLELEYKIFCTACIYEYVPKCLYFQLYICLIGSLF